MTVGDVNGDGRADVLETTSSEIPDAALGVLAQNSQGQLNAPVRYKSDSIPGPVVVADLSGDGRNDVVVAHSDYNEVGVYTQQADGTLSTERLFPVEYPDFEQKTIAVGDINGDGKPDIVVTGNVDADAGAVAILYQK